MDLTYPKVNALLNLDAVPDELHFITDAIASMLERVHYDELFVSVTQDDSSGYYSLTLLLNEKIRFEIPNTNGLAIRLNPVVTPIEGFETAIPISVGYNIGIWQFLRHIKIENIADVPDVLFNLLLIISRADNADMLRSICENIIGGSDPAQDLVDNLNTNYGPSPLLVLSTDESIKYFDLRDQILNNNTPLNLPAILFSDYLITGTPAEALNKVKLFFKQWFAEISFKDILNLFIPKIFASINSINVGVEFPLNVFRRVDPITFEPLIDPVTHGFVKTILTVDLGSLSYSSGDGFAFDSHTNVDFPLSEIMRTGLLLQITDLEFDFSKTSNIAAADEDGRPNDFVGIYTAQVDVILPKKWFKEETGQTLKISGTNLLIGTGGISGTLAIQTVNNTPPTIDDYFWFKLGKDAAKAWRLGFNKFDITFKQNAVTGSNIVAALEIPKFKSPSDPTNPLRININGHLYEDGDISLTASVAGGVEANLFNFVTFNFLTLELGRKDDNFYIGTSCEVWFTNPIMAKILNGQHFTLPALRVYSNGQIEITNGTSFIPTNLNLNLGPIDISVTGIHLGSYQGEHNGVQRKYNYWGFDGAISIDPLCVDAKGSGIKYYYTTDNDEHGGEGHSFIRIQTLKITLTIPGNASPETAMVFISGSLTIPEPGESPEYAGSVDLRIPKLKIAGGGIAFRLQPKYPAFLIDAHIDLTTPIPLGPVAIYGFRGLIGYRYVAEKEAIGLVSGVDTWYDYYKHPVKGINIDKFSGPERTKDYSFPISLGAGAVLGTSFDSGTIASVRAMLLLSIPSLFMIEGKAGILTARLGLADDKEPPFFAFIAWGDHSLELGIGADFLLSRSNGWIIDVHAEAQAGFFFNNASRWYVNIGTKQDPVKARLLTILTAQAYLMFSSAGIEAGARVEFDLRKNFGIAKVHLNAYVEVGGHISFERPQIGGYLALGGMIEIEIWIVGLSLSLDALLSVEAPKPFLLYAELKIRVCVRIIVKICKSFTIELSWEKDGTVDRTPIAALPMSNSEVQQNRTNELVKGTNMLTNETFDLDYFTSVPSAGAITKIIPMDTFIDIKAVKGLIPNAVDTKIGGHVSGAANFTDLVSPESIVRGGRHIRQVKHTYSIEAIEIKAWNGSQWVDYHPYQAIIEDENVTNLRIGYWQRAGDQYDTIRLLATDPFSYTQSGEPGWFIPEQYGINPSTLFCITKQETPHCSNMLNQIVGTIFYNPTQYVAHFINGAYYSLITGVTYDPTNGGVAGLDGNYMKITDYGNPFGFAKSLSFNNYNSLQILLPDPSVKICLKLTTTAESATISYYKKLIDDTTPEPQYELVDSYVKTAAELTTLLDYTNNDDPISKVVIAPAEPNAAAIQAIMEQIAELFNTTYEDGSGNVNVTEPSDPIAYHALLDELNSLQAEGCTAGNRFFFNNYYSTNDTDVRSVTFIDIVRIGEYYVVAASLVHMDEPVGSSTSLLLKINGKGDIVLEKKISGAIDQVVVINGHLFVTMYNLTIDGLAIIPVLLKLDAAFTQISCITMEVIRSGSYQFNPFNNSKYALWITASSTDRTAVIFPNGSKISLVDTDTLQIIEDKFLDAYAIKKGVRKDDNSFVYVTYPVVLTTQSLILSIELTPDNHISLVENYQFNTYLEDIVKLEDDTIMVSGVSMPDSIPYVAKYDSGSLSLYPGYDLGLDALSLATGPIMGTANCFVAYNLTTIYVLVMDNGLILKSTLSINQPSGISALRIRKIVINDANNEVFIVWRQLGNEKGDALSVTDTDFTSCLFTKVDINSSPVIGFSALPVPDSSVLDPESYTVTPITTDLTIVSQYITNKTVLCPAIIRTDEPVFCATSLQQICWLTIAQHEFNETIPGQGAISEDQQAMVDAMQKTAQPIWRPNTKFYVHFRFKDTVDNGASAPGIFDYYYGFKTVGPVGHYDKAPGVNYVLPGTNPDQYPLTSLSSYIDYNRSYPNADGNLLQAKPLFYGHSQCKISIFFEKAEAYHMFQKWYAYNGLPELSGELHIAIKDPATNVVIPYPLPEDWTDETVPLPDGSDVWANDDDPRIPLNIRMLNNMINYINSHSTAIQCTLTIGHPIVPAAYQYTLTLTNLAPSKLYTALLYNAFETNSDNVLKSELVHQFVFKTSRYTDFETQVNSYILKDSDGNEKNAVFSVPLELSTADITTAYNIIAGIADPASSALETKYMQLLDRVIEGVLGIVPADPAVTTEFNVIKDTLTGDTIAVWVRNPEPFNIPKIPLADVLDTITVMDGTGHVDSNYKVLYSKDYAQALIMHSSKKIVATSLSIRFIYKTWNGSVYNTASTITTPQISINI
jgi:hypothetical protein